MALAPASSHGIDTSAANTWTGNQTAPAWISSGLTGATAASRYVGATASAAPGSGTFAVGDFVIDQTGKIFVCTVAGSPGTWVQVGGSGGGVTVDSYATNTSSVSVVGTAASPTTLVTAAAITADGSTVYRIEYFCSDFSAAATSNCFGFIYDGATKGPNVWTYTNNAAVGQDVPIYGVFYITPTAASHTYSLRAGKSAGTVTAGAGDGTGGNAPPIYIRVSHGG